jgi:hypothetical protein
LGPRDAAVSEDILGKGSHQPKQHHRQQHGPMRPHVLVLIPCLLCHHFYSPQNYYFYLQWQNNAIYTVETVNFWLFLKIEL